MKSSEIKGLLPEILQRGISDGSPLQTIVDLMEVFHESVEEKFDDIDRQFDPRRSDPDLIPLLATWVDLQWLLRKTPLRRNEDAGCKMLTDGLGRLRELTANIAYFSRWRGTVECMRLFLRTASGIDAVTIEEDVRDEHGVPIPFHIRITLPRAVQQQKEIVELIDLIVQKEKPAYVTYEVQFG